MGVFDHIAASPEEARLWEEEENAILEQEDRINALFEEFPYGGWTHEHVRSARLCRWLFQHHQVRDILTMLFAIVWCVVGAPLMPLVCLVMPNYWQRWKEISHRMWRFASKAAPVLPDHEIDLLDNAPLEASARRRVLALDPERQQSILEAFKTIQRYDLMGPETLETMRRTTKLILEEGQQ